MVIDFHAHCFPPILAARVVPRLEASAGIKARLDGTLETLLASMHSAGVDLSVVHHIATGSGQEPTINHWAAEIESPRLLSFGTIHPRTRGWREELRRLIDLGLRGVKFHPDYQEFFVDEPRMFPIYEAIVQEGLIILLHAGVDLSQPLPCHCTPAGLRRVFDRFPEGRWVAAHLGGHRLWEEVEDCLLGLNLYLDTAFCQELTIEKRRRLIRAHGVERILFGSDSPWIGQAEALAHLRELDLTPAENEAILAGNARRLLGL